MVVFQRKAIFIAALLFPSDYRTHIISYHATLYGHVHQPLNLLVQVRRRLKLVCYFCRRSGRCRIGEAGIKKQNSGTIRFMDSIASRKIAYQFESPTNLHKQVERPMNVSIHCRMTAVVMDSVLYFVSPQFWKEQSIPFG
jgi:UDP:flavonoid glycosyltransferase YjiC (YdhE family)